MPHHPNDLRGWFEMPKHRILHSAPIASNKANRFRILAACSISAVCSLLLASCGSDGTVANQVNSTAPGIETSTPADPLPTSSEVIKTLPSRDPIIIVNASLKTSDGTTLDAEVTFFTPVRATTTDAQQFAYLWQGCNDSSVISQQQSVGIYPFDIVTKDTTTGGFKFNGYSTEVVAVAPSATLVGAGDGNGALGDSLSRDRCGNHIIGQGSGSGAVLRLAMYSPDFPDGNPSWRTGSYGIRGVLESVQNCSGSVTDYGVSLGLPEESAVLDRNFCAVDLAR